MKVEKAYGYSESDGISDIHTELGCGNPVAFASIQEGENVLDLGSGDGINTLLVAKIIGTQGQAIGLDVSMDMIERARTNARLGGLRSPNVSFVHMQLSEPFPIASDSIDCIISNGVINLLPLNSKANVFKEAFRVLKPGGRIALHDIIYLKLQSDDIKRSLALYMGSMASSILQIEYERFLREAGFIDSVFKPTGEDLNVYKEAATNSSPPSSSAFPQIVSDIDFNEWAGAFQIYALKPARTGGTATEPLLQWWTAYPVAISSPASLSSGEVAEMIAKADPDFAIIDVRRTDFKGYKVKLALQRPAQSFYDELEEFHTEFGKYKRVVFYCGSSRGRGPRCAAWYQDYLDGLGKQNTNGTKAFILAGGIKEFEVAHPSLSEKISE